MPNQPNTPGESGKNAAEPQSNRWIDAIAIVVSVLLFCIAIYTFSKMTYEFQCCSKGLLISIGSSSNAKMASAGGAK